MSNSPFAADRAATETTTPLPNLPNPRTRHVAYLHQGLNEVYVVVVDREKTGAERDQLRFNPYPGARKLEELSLEIVLEQLQDRDWQPQGTWTPEPEFGGAMYTCPVIPRPRPITVQQLADQAGPIGDVLALVEQLLELDDPEQVIARDAEHPRDVVLTAQAAATIRRQLQAGTDTAPESK